MKLIDQSKVIDKTKIFGVEGIKFAGMVKGGGSNNHIRDTWSVAERVGLTKARKYFVNGFAHLKQVELVNEFKVLGKTFFIPASQQKFVTRNAGNGKVSGT